MATTHSTSGAPHSAGELSEIDAKYINEGGTPPGDRKFRPDIEGLRAVSVILVVAFHTGTLGVIGGFVGVDVFFVISGFVITGVLLRQHTSTGRPKMLEFYGRRVLRIVPMATVVIAAAMIAERVSYGATVARLSTSGFVWSALFGANFHSTIVLGNYWSLGVEEQFYLVYPALLLLIAIAGRQWSFRAKLAVVLSVIVVASYSWSALHPAAAYSSVFGRAWELAAGALLALSTGYLKRLPAPIATAMTWSGLVGLLIIAFTLAFSASYPGTIAALPVGATALIIAGGTAVPRFGAEAMLRLSPFKWLGRWSYSLYLWHLPILLIGLHNWHRQLGDSLNLMLAGFAVVLSVASYFCIENPIRKSALLNRTPLTSIAFGAVMVSICLGIILLVGR